MSSFSCDSLRSNDEPEKGMVNVTFIYASKTYSRKNAFKAMWIPKFFYVFEVPNSECTEIKLPDMSHCFYRKNVKNGTISFQGWDSKKNMDDDNAKVFSKTWKVSSTNYLSDMFEESLAEIKNMPANFNKDMFVGLQNVVIKFNY